MLPVGRIKETYFQIQIMETTALLARCDSLLKADKFGCAHCTSFPVKQNGFSLVYRNLPRGGGTSYNSLYGEAPPEKGTFFRLQVYKRVGISQVEV